jgi:hypothetical protein
VSGARPDVAPVETGIGSVGGRDGATLPVGRGHEIGISAGIAAPVPISCSAVHAGERSALRRWPTSHEHVDQLALDVPATCRGDKKVGHNPVVCWEVSQAILAVAVQEPTRQEQGRSLVALAEPLRPRDSVRQNCGRLDDVLEPNDRVERALHAFEIIGLVEPLVLATLGPVESERLVERRADQWSCR